MSLRVRRGGLTSPQNSHFALMLFPHQSPDFSVVVTRDTKRNPCHRMRLSYVGHEPTEVKFKMSWRRAKAKMQLAAALVQELRLKHKEV